MKRILRISIFIFLFFLTFSPMRSDADSELPLGGSEKEPEISMDFQDVSLKDLLKAFSIQSGLNFIASEAVQNRKITLYLDRVPLNSAMGQLFKANNLSYELDRESNIFVVKDWGALKTETVTKIFKLKFASVSKSSLLKEMSKISPSEGAGGEGASGGVGPTTTGGEESEKTSGITQAVEKLLSSAGSVIEDGRTNSLIVTDAPNRMPIIVEVIAALDVPTPQVMLEVEMLDVSKDVIDKLGFNHFSSSNPITLALPGGLRNAEWFIGNLSRIKNDLASSGIAGSVVLGAHFGQLLDFLHKQTDTKFLARPRILTLNNQTAEIKITTNEAVAETTITQGQGTASTTSKTVERIETGVSLRVTPQVNIETNEVTMVILPKVKEATPSTWSGVTAKDAEERSTSSMVRVKDGETVIIGGLIRNNTQVTKSKIPILGDIPIIGALFRHKGSDSDKVKERELLVFITPRIIKDNANQNIEIAQAKPVILREDPFFAREQGAVLGANRQESIDVVLDNLEKRYR